MQQRGFTIIEMLIVVLVVGLIAALAVPSYEKAIDAARVARAIGDIKAMERELLVYDALNGHLPASLSEIGREELLDPWQNPYVYLNFYVDPSPGGSGNGQGGGGNGQGGGGANGGGNGGAQGGGNSGTGGGQGHGNQVPPQVQGLMRRDRNLVPLNTRFDLYSQGKDGESRPPLTAKASWDDVLRANDGSFVGLASNY
ncbi:MAG: prepilin-type N-terminal cleavage/methylation domain-containing protein [Acidobacteriota bacterium]